MDSGTLYRPNISLTQALLVFYIIIASNFTDGLFSKQIRTYFNENRVAQHLIAFIMLLVIIILFSGQIQLDNAIFLTIIGYSWFILSQKMDGHFIVIIILLLLFGFIIDMKLSESDKVTLADPNLTEQQKQEIINTHYNYRVYYLLLIFAVTIIGVALYMNKKVVQYGGGSSGKFDLTTFLFY